MPCAKEFVMRLSLHYLNVFLDVFLFMTLFFLQQVRLLFMQERKINEAKAKIIDESPIEMVEIRSVLTCESKYGMYEVLRDVTLLLQEWFS